jgi:hypothetical protein
MLLPLFPRRLLARVLPVAERWLLAKGSALLWTRCSTLPGSVKFEEARTKSVPLERLSTTMSEGLSTR